MEDIEINFDIIKKELDIKEENIKKLSNLIEEEKEEMKPLYIKNIEDKKLNIELIKDIDKICIKIIDMNNIVNFVFIRSLTLDELRKNNDYFLIIKDIDNLFLYFRNLLNQNKFEINKNIENDIYHITFFFNTIIADEKLELDLEKEKINLLAENKKIHNTLNFLENKINDKSNILNNKIDENRKILESEIEKIKKFNNNIINQIKEETKNYFLNLCWPIGSYYWTNKNNNPENLFGGKWQKIEGKFLYSADNNRPVDSTGGQERVTLKENEMPRHYHTPYGKGNFVKYKNHWRVNVGGGGDSITCLDGSGNWHDDFPCLTDYAGGDQSHENMPPYIAAFCWKRIG